MVLATFYYCADDMHIEGTKCYELYNKPQLECGPMPHMMAALPNIGGALCERSIIPFLVPCHKLWLTLVLEYHAVMLPI